MGWRLKPPTRINNCLVEAGLQFFWRESSRWQQDLGSLLVSIWSFEVQNCVSMVLREHLTSVFSMDSQVIVWESFATMQEQVCNDEIEIHLVQRHTIQKPARLLKKEHSWFEIKQRWHWYRHSRAFWGPVREGISLIARVLWIWVVFPVRSLLDNCHVDRKHQYWAYDPCWESQTTNMSHENRAGQPSRSYWRWVATLMAYRLSPLPVDLIVEFSKNPRLIWSTSMG